MSTFQQFASNFLITEDRIDFAGHLSNAEYLRLYDQARWEIITNLGYGLDAIQRDNVGPVIRKVTIHYRREVRNREQVTITSQMMEIAGSRVMRWEQKMIGADGKIRSEADYEIVFFNIRDRRPVPVPEDFIEKNKKSADQN